MSELWDIVYDASAWIVPVLLAVTLHEAAHGFAANRLGDNTAKLLGRVTLNPFKHIDRFGTILLPGLLLLMKSPVTFGYAKPVPVDFSRLKPLKLGMLVVAIAGPGINIFLALISALMLHAEAFVTPEQAPWFYMNIYRSIIINAALATFNMIPLLPLDGGRVVAALLPGNAGVRWAQTERFGMLIIIALLFLPPLVGINGVMEVFSEASGFVIRAVMMATGNSFPTFD